MTPWNDGPIDLTKSNGQTNIAQIHTASQNGKGNIYWWRNLLPGESLYDACKDFYAGTLSLPSLGTIVASFIVYEFTPNGQHVIQSRGFAASTEELDLFTQG